MKNHPQNPEEPKLETENLTLSDLTPSPEAS
jgi:hypothetical protein